MQKKICGFGSKLPLAAGVDKVADLISAYQATILKGIQFKDQPLMLHLILSGDNFRITLYTQPNLSVCKTGFELKLVMKSLTLGTGLSILIIIFPQFYNSATILQSIGFYD